MERHVGPVVVKSCHLCTYFEIEYSGEHEYEALFLCAHPIRLLGKDDDRLLDIFALTPGDCPAETESAITEVDVAKEAVRVGNPFMNNDDEDDHEESPEYG